MKIKIINDEQLAKRWKVRENDIYDVFRVVGDGYWIKTPSGDEVKILRDECKIIEH